MLEENIWSLSQERQIVINVGANLEFIDLCKYYNHLDLYKISIML